MNDLKYKYFIFKGSSNFEYFAIDRVRKVIYGITKGLYQNVTKECKKLYEKDIDKIWAKKRAGAILTECLISGDKHGITDELVLQTNDLKAFDLKCMEIRKDQVNLILENINREKENLLKENQYFTYTFSNMKHVIGQDTLDKSYFKNEIENENTLENIIKPKEYENKEQKYMILDEVYDLGTSFKYIEEPKNDYEKFMKYIAENIIVKDIWKDNTIIVGLEDFVKKHIREVTHIFGNQTGETHVENLIRMIEKDVSENCYADFRKEFKTDFKFMFCNGYTFEDLKNMNIKELDYEVTGDLVFVENRDAHTSAYLGVYDNNFLVTYSVHSTKDFDNIYENTIADDIDMGKIKNEEDLKNTLKTMLMNYYNGRDEVINKLAEKLDEEIVSEAENSEETL